VADGVRPVLAVDADPNSVLALTLGEEAGATIADLRDRMGEAAQKVSEIPKQRLMSQWLDEVLTECAGFDILTMGRPEGPKCYCYVNSLLRRYLKELRGNYAAVVVDCEAGMEYLSRLTVDDVEVLILVAEATRVGLTTAERISRLADGLPMKVRRKILAVNKVGGMCPAPDAAGVASVSGVEATVEIPFDEDLYRRAVEGRAVDEGAGGPARPAVAKLARLCLGRRGAGAESQTQRS
jgi:CO dehydrogenase maturation factor